jgi:tetratricopeptide (TPR) repeat protein
VAGGEEYSGLIAVHLERAGRTEQALDYFRRAGENALASYANAEAENYFRKALELDPSSSNRPALLGGLAEALVRQGYLDRAIATWKEGLSLYQAQREQEGMARLYTAVIRSLAIQRPNEAVKLIEIALPAVEGLQSSSALGHLLHQSARAYFFSGQKELAEPLCRQALAIAERFEDLELQADTLATLGLLYDDRPDEAIRIMDSFTSPAAPITTSVVVIPILIGIYG